LDLIIEEHKPTKGWQVGSLSLDTGWSASWPHFHGEAKKKWQGAAGLKNSTYHVGQLTMCPAVITN